MDLNREPHQMASAAAEEIRALNHRTLDTKAFPHPASVSDTANGIATLLERLPQALQQLEAGIVQLHDNNAIRLDNKPPAETSRQDIAHEVFTVVAALQEARDRLGQAQEAMREAAGPLSHMGAPWGDSED